MLSDSPGFTLSDIGFPDGVQQGGFPVIDMPHNRNDRRTQDTILFQIVFFLFLKTEFRLWGDDFNFKPSLIGDFRGHFQAQALVDGGHGAQSHQVHNDIVGRAF